MPQCHMLHVTSKNYKRIQLNYTGLFNIQKCFTFTLYSQQIINLHGWWNLTISTTTLNELESQKKYGYDQNKG